MTDLLWRAPAPQSKPGRLRSIIPGNRDLRLAVAGADGDYVLSDTGVGVQPLVFVGTRRELATWLAANADCRIVNRTRSPYLYAGMDVFRPGEPFRGGASFHDLAGGHTPSQPCILRVSSLAEDGLRRVASGELRFGTLPALFA